MAYVYRHIREDLNVPFYIGIGSNQTYKRAHVRNRNKHWKSVVAKTQYSVEIVMENLTWEEACSKEVELIKLYGRADLQQGPLTNKTDGGDGSVGALRNLDPEVEKQRRYRIGQKNKGRVREDLAVYNKGRSGVNHPYFGKSSPKKGKRDPKASDRAKALVQCPHCSIAGQKIVMVRWHFQNCKQLHN